MSAPKVRKDVARNRSRILSAARIAFREHGSDAPVATIARIAGIGTATLYRHFPSREDLLSAMYGAEARHRIRVLDDAVTQPDAWQGLVTALETVVDMDSKSPGLSDAILTKRHSIPIYDELRDHALSDLSLLLRRLQTEEIVDEELTVADIFLILSALKGVTEGASADAPSRARRLIHLLSHGIRKGKTI